LGAAKVALVFYNVRRVGKKRRLDAANKIELGKTNIQTLGALASGFKAA
jgi:hypothetical protein